MKQIGVITLICLFLAGGAYYHTDRHPDKIWLHRCNSLEKRGEMKERYPNFETDLVWRDSSGYLDVTHDLPQSYGTSLEDFFIAIKGSDSRMWLDIKNLNKENAVYILNHLDSLCTIHGIDRRHLIVESSSTEGLIPFTRNGFYTSYYVPFPSPHRLNRTERAACIARLQEVADKEAVCALSFPSVWYGEIKKHLNRDIDLLTWRHRDIQLQVFLSLSGIRMLNDEQLKVILVKDKGHYHR